LSNDPDNCDTGCSSCTEASSHCTSCDDGYIYIKRFGTCILNTPDDDCHLEKFYENNAACVDCNIPCLDCETTASSCTKCYDYYSASILNKKDNTCVETCPEGVTI